jgi:hypothetical protein
MAKMIQRHGEPEKGDILPFAAKSRPSLAGYDGFTDPELDFIINYDIKYRLGPRAEGDGDE